MCRHFLFGAFQHNLVCENQSTSCEDTSSINCDNISLSSGSFPPAQSPSPVPKYATSMVSRGIAHKLKPKIVLTYLPYSQITH